MAPRQFFWLHIKKSAGITTRDLLRPYYVEVARAKKPKGFIQASPEEYNDILNNYRVVLGDYQFRRCLFARRFLYAERWDALYSFAFAREPVDRCLSMFWYFCRREPGLRASLEAASRAAMNDRGQPLGVAYALDVFLEYVQQARCSASIYQPFSLHFTTHTAPMWDDVVDDSGLIMLASIFRLEALTSGLDRVFEACGLSRVLDRVEKRLYRNKTRQEYTPTREQLSRIEAIYGRDFDLYESALS